MIQRKIFGHLLQHLQKQEHTILIGARQTGKSTLLKQLAEFLSNTGEQVVSLNLERKDILIELDRSAESIFKYFNPEHSSRTFILIDEIQYLADPSHFLKLLYDEYAGKIKIIATGSSAFYIDRQFKDSLAGRKKIFELPTLDFEEFLLFKGEESLCEQIKSFRSGKIKKSIFEMQLWIFLEEYLTYGGYPAVVLETGIQEKIERLMELRDSFVKRDILESGITDEIKFYRMMILLAGQTGSLLNVNELANTLRISAATAEEYLFVLQKCFHIGLLKPFFNNLRKELVKMPKIYFNDLGLRNMLVSYFAPVEQRADKGALLKNYVYRRLIEQYAREHIKFWRTSDGNEVDFVVEETLEGGHAVEVKFSSAEVSVSRYNKFTTTYPDFPLKFVSWRESGLLF
ncbi:MAG: ATP-binding protein [Bacteroidia bacterium]